MNWHNVSYKEPCPICGKPDWCTLSNDGMICVCKRVQSNYPSKSGQGWIHVLVERPREERRFVRVPERPKPKLFDAQTTMRGFRNEFTTPLEGDIFDSLLAISKDLDLVAADIDLLEVGKSAFHHAWAFPMLDGEGKCVGIRLRKFGSSQKWSVAGSSDGLFYTPTLLPRESVYNGLKGREIVIVEGATDTIAGYSLGLPCVGRSSCMTGKNHLNDLCNRLKVGRLTIVSDNDSYKTRSDGSCWRPGVEGAISLAKSLKRLYRIVTPPKKDLREWVKSGLTADMFWMVASLQPWKI